MKKLLFYVLIATFPLGVLTRISILPSVNIYLADFLILLIILVSWKEIIQYLIKSKSNSVFIFCVFSLVGIIGVLGHTKSLFEVASSLSYLLRISCYLIILIPLTTINKISLLKMRLEMLVSGFIFILFGYAQYFYYPSLRNLYYLGWDEHLYRLFSTFLDPNFAGAFMVLIIILYLLFFFERFRKSNIKSRFIYTLGFPFLFPALFLTYSRSSYIMGVFAIILFLILARLKKLVFVFGIALVLGLFLLPKNLGGEGVKLFRTSSIISRSVSYENSLRVFFDNPIIGVGFNSLRFVSGRYGFITQKDLLVSHAGAGVPDSYLFILTTTGMVGFLLFLSFIFLALKKVLAAGEDHSTRLYSICVFTSIAGVLVGSLFENFLFYSQIMLWLIMLTGIFFGVVRKTQR